MADNMVTLIGTLGADPEVRRTPTGKDVVSFSLVTNDRIRGADGTWSDGPASWFKVVAWGDLGVHAGMSFRKGQRVIARGALRIDTWQARDGGTGRTVELTAQALGHDLRWGTSTFARTSPPKQQPQAPQRSVDDGWGGASGEDVGTAQVAAATGSQAAVPQPAWSTMLADGDEVPF